MTMRRPPSSRSWPRWTATIASTGYVVYRVKDGVRHVFDLACTDSKSTIDALLAEFVADARRERAVGTHLPLPRLARPVSNRG